MTAYGVVITVLLGSPWVLVGVVFVGAALERIQRGRRFRRPAPQLDPQRYERSMGPAVRSLSE